MNDTLKKLQKYYSNEKYLVNLFKENELTRFFKKELDISTPEANIFGIILFWYIRDGVSVLIKDICDDYNISYNHYLKIIDYISSLEDKGYLIIEAKGRKSRMLNPEIEVDEIVFKKLIYGEDLISDCDFKNLYSIIDKVKELIELKEDEKISLKYFLQTIKEISARIDYNLTLHEIVSKYSLNEVVLFFYTLVRILDTWNDEIELGDFSDFMELRLKEKMELMDKIISNELPIFRDKILEISKGEKGLFSSATDLEIKVSSKVLSKILNRKKSKNFKLNSKLLRQISISKKDKIQKLFFSEEFEEKLEKIKKFLSKKRFKKVKNELKERGFSQGAVILFYGKPGTGKTATAYEIAKITGREVLQVDFSQVQSMWVGESEKNMKRIFDEYRAALSGMKHEPILLFNEADSLISKRVNVLDSVDQMSNTLQNILLEELENFEGIFIATTNLIDNIDPAFDRRFIYKLKFEMPDKTIRKKIWKSKLPELPDQYIEKIAEYNLSGGQIDNIVKKYLINQIIDGKEIEIEELLKYIKEELEFRDSTVKVIGFKKDK